MVISASGEGFGTSCFWPQESTAAQLYCSQRNPPDFADSCAYRRTQFRKPPAFPQEHELSLTPPKCLLFNSEIN